MDERKLGELFNAAVPDAPPPSFNYKDVAAEANLQRVRRRNALMGGSALGVALLVGTVLLGVALWKGTDAGEPTSAASGPMVARESGNGGAAQNEVPNEDAERSDASAGAAPETSFSAESPKQGGTPTGNAGPSGPGSTPSGCEKADLELAAALAGELQAAVNRDSAVPVDITCPLGSRGAAFQLSDGVLSLVVTPADAQLRNPVAGKSEDTAIRTAKTGNGRQVLLVSEPGSGSTDPPYFARLQDIVNAVAGKV